MNQTIWNYLPKAKSELLGIADDIDEQMPRTSRFIRVQIASCEESVKFAMPPNGRIINDDFRGLPDGFRLPYGSICIEYPVGGDDNGKDIIPKEHVVKSSKRIVMASEYPLDENINVGGIAEVVIDSVRKTAPPGTTHMIIVMCLNEIDGQDGGQWLPGWSFGIVYNSRRGDEMFSGSAAPLPCELGDKITHSLHEEGLDLVTYCRQDIAHEVRAVLELCEALSCSNVRAEKISAPAKLNAKRLKNGKSPLPDYHVLTISSHQHQDEKATRASVGDRRAPRQHLRRGHVRIYKSGMRIWINSMVVGSAANGKINKDYRVTA